MSARTEGGKPPRRNDASAADKAAPDKMDDSGRAPGPFDVRTVKALVALMTQHDLSEIDLREGDLRIRLRRGAHDLPSPTLSVSAPAASVPASANAPPAAAANAEPAKPAKTLIPIKSPTPGTFYRAPSPDAEPFVKVGARNLLLKGERERFLAEHWPRVAEKIRRLGLTQEELDSAAKKHSAAGDGGTYNIPAKKEKR